MDVLARLGVGSEADTALARAELEAAGLTNPRKTRISPEKIPRVEEVLARAFVLLCAECAAGVPADGRRLIAVSASACRRCGGSAARRSALRLGGAGRRLRVVVVGGSAGTRSEIDRQLAPIAELRQVDGTARWTKERAAADHAWADVVVIWAGTELRHKVSMLYSQIPDRGGKRITVAKRGAAALIDAITAWAARREAESGVRRGRAPGPPGGRACPPPGTAGGSILGPTGPRRG